MQEDRAMEERCVLEAKGGAPLPTLLLRFHPLSISDATALFPPFPDIGQ